MTLIEQLDADMIAAMKGKDALTLKVTRQLKSAMNNQKIALMIEALSEEQALEVCIKEMKKLQDSLKDFTAAQRNDLIEEVTQEISVLSRYLPAPLSDEELRAIVKETVDEAKAAGNTHPGKLMGAVMGKVKGRAQADVVNALVQEYLA